jgi:phenylalanine-4-hydroxylase
MAPRDLDAYGIYEGKKLKLEFESGVVVEGRTITGTRDRRGKILLISLDECTVTYKDQVLFQPDWGVYDMAIGKEVVSAYAGPADVQSFHDFGKVSETKTEKIVYTERERELYKLYDEVRALRDADSATEERISEILNVLKSDFPKDWLLALELYELAYQNEFSIQGELLSYLEELKKTDSYKKLIENGLALIGDKEFQEINSTLT